MLYSKGNEMSSDELYDMFSKMSVEEAMKWMKRYADDGYPESMNKSMTFRALARWASMAIEGTPKEDHRSLSYMDTKYGSDFYWTIIGMG